MKKMLFLGKGGEYTFRDLAGECVLSDLPFAVLVFVNRANARHFDNVRGNVTIEVVTWGDMQDVARRAREAHAKHGLFGINTPAEILVQFAAELRQELGIPGALPDDVLRFRDKVIMKQQLTSSHVRLPHFVTCDNRETVAALQHRFGKIVIKPRVGLSSIGVSFINNPAQLQQWFEQTDDPQKYEAEEYVDGVMYHVNAIVENTAVTTSVPAIYQSGMANVDFKLGTPFITHTLRDSDLKQRLIDLSDSVIAQLGMVNGVTHLECFVTAEQEIIFCEMGIRPAGGALVWMVEAQCGIHFTRANLLLEAGANELIELQQQQGISALIGFRLGDALQQVESAPDARDFNEDWIKLVRVYTRPGELATPTAYSTDFLSALVIAAENEADFGRKFHLLENRFKRKFVAHPL